MTNTGKQPTIKLAAIDLDGTLLDGREQIPTKTVDHLITLQQNGLRIVLCSGRSPFEMEVYARQLQMDVYDGYLIYTNGSGIEGCQSDLSLRFPSLSASQIHTLLRIGRTFHLLIYAPQEGCYFLEGGPRMKRLFAFGRQRFSHPTHPLTKLFSLVIIVEDLERALSQQTNKLCFRGSPRQIRRMGAYLDSRLPDRFSIFHLSGSCIEVNQKHVDKGEALAQLCQRLHIPAEQVIVFGDSANDHPLFERFPNSVAMGNADRITRQKAAHVTATNNEEGVRQYLQSIDL